MPLCRLIAILIVGIISLPVHSAPRCIDPTMLKYSSVWLGFPYTQYTTDRSHGSAFVLSPNFIFTAHHAAELITEDKRWIKTPLLTYGDYIKNGSKQPENLTPYERDVRIVDFNGPDDVALIEVKQQLLGVVPIKVSKVKPLPSTFGLSIGHPLDEYFVVARLRFKVAKWLQPPGRRHYPLSERTNYSTFSYDYKPKIYNVGSSGAPNFNCEGLFVGMNIILSGRDPPNNYGVPLAAIVSMIRLTTTDRSKPRTVR